MQKLLAVILMIALMPGCCLVGMTVGGASAASHNSTRARELEAGQQPDETHRDEESVGAAALSGFALGGVIDVILVSLVMSDMCHNFSIGSGPSNDGYVSAQD